MNPSFSAHQQHNKAYNGRRVEFSSPVQAVDRLASNGQEQPPARNRNARTPPARAAGRGQPSRWPSPSPTAATRTPLYATEGTMPAKRSTNPAKRRASSGTKRTCGGPWEPAGSSLQPPGDAVLAATRRPAGRRRWGWG